MKKAVFFMTFVILLFSAFSVNAAQLYYDNAYHNYNAGEIKLIVGGKSITNLPMTPVIINDSTMVPVREVFEALGSSVIWHNDTNQVEVKDNGVSIFLKIGDRNTYINGKEVPIDKKLPVPMLIGKSPAVVKSMVPVRFVAEKLGFTVKWDNSTRTVSIYEGTPSEIIGSVEKNDITPEEVGKFGTVKTESDSKYDYVYILTRYGFSPKISRYEDPKRVVFDFEDATFVNAGGAVPLNGNCVKNVRYSNHENHARLVLDVSDNAQVMILSSDKGILIRTEKSNNTKIVYDTYSGRVYFDKNYAGSGKSVNNGYSVNFTNLKLESQKIEIRDGKIYDILITNSQSGTTIMVDGSSKLTYTAENGFFKSDAPITENKPEVNVNGKKVVVLDAGHGGEDPGAVGYNSSGKAVAYESHINLAITLLVGKKLESNGIEVIYTRNKDNYISLADRVEISNNSECDLFVSVHCNSIDNGEVAGTQVYYHPSSTVGGQLAENIYDKIVNITGLAPKKTQNGSHLFVIRKTASPAVLVETAFISNENDRNFLLSSQGQEKMAEAITQGIIKTLI